jgi:hypothetical protein
MDIEKTNILKKMLDRSGAEADIIRAIEKLGGQEVIAIVLRHVDRKHEQAQKAFNAAKAAAEVAHATVRKEL